MTKFDNKTVIQKYFNEDISNYRSGVESHTGNLYISGDGKRLCNYGTVLVERTPIGWVYNATKYSPTTSKIQSYIRYYQSQSNNWHVVEGVHRGASFLSTYLPIELIKEIQELEVR